MSMSATTESAQYGCTIGFDLLVTCVRGRYSGVSVEFAEGYVCEVHRVCLVGMWP